MIELFVLLQPVLQFRLLFFEGRVLLAGGLQSLNEGADLLALLLEGCCAVGHLAPECHHLLLDMLRYLDLCMHLWLHRFLN